MKIMIRPWEGDNEPVEIETGEQYVELSKAFSGVSIYTDRAPFNIVQVTGGGIKVLLGNGTLLWSSEGGAVDPCEGCDQEKPVCCADCLKANYPGASLGVSK